jgi:ABC-2 type transport system permease protein
MILDLVRVSRTQLRRDRMAQMMVFVMPIAFFSIFAIVFGRQGSGRMPHIEVALVDEDHSDASRALFRDLAADSNLTVRDSIASRADAIALVKGGDVPVAVVLPRGWGERSGPLSANRVSAEIFADPSDPVARGAVVGLLQAAGARRMLRSAPRSRGMSDSVEAAFGMPVPTHTQDVAGPSRPSGRNMISFYAAGIAVMFLLFSCSAGGGALIDEQDSGTLERVLNTRIGMNGLLAAKWLHLMLLGALQVTVMFVWGMLVFGLDLMHHLPGFLVMTLFTAAAAAGFGLVLATLSRTRQQLMGFANIIILSMSALGGSMFPRFLMSPGMQKLGLLTFNGWALDGYIKVFWREAPLGALAPQVGVLAGLTVVFLTLARLLARRWEAV